MSSSAPPTNPQPAPWRALFLQHLSTLRSSASFTLSTLAPVSAPASAPGTTPALAFAPRARTCIHRGLWTHLPENSHNDAPRNPAGVFASDCLTATSDARMDKVAELFATGPGRAEVAEVESGVAGKDAERDAEKGRIRGSGGGGPVEAMYWVTGEVMCQWRFKGQGWIVDAADIEDEERKGDSGVRAVKRVVGTRMRKGDGGEAKEDDWSWKREVEAHWGNLSPGMRGTFIQPPPGQDKKIAFDDKGLKMGEKIESGLGDSPEEATRHFRLLIVTPDEVEMLDLSDPAKAFRKKYVYDEMAGTWSEAETWP